MGGTPQLTLAISGLAGVLESLSGLAVGALGL